MNNIFNIQNQVVLITGGYGTLGGSITKYLSSEGALPIILGRDEEKSILISNDIKEKGNKVDFFQCDVLSPSALNDVKDRIVKKYGKIDALINVAGGNIPAATIKPDQSIFDLNFEDWDNVVDLNLNGTVFPTLIFGKVIAKQKKGNIINITSMATYSAISRVLGYSVAKSGIANFTQWMAMEMAQKFSDKIRVNAIAPGFFIGNQNRNVLINPDGSLTERSKKVLAKTPMNRFGDLSELNGGIHFLLSEAASFMTGSVIPIDGGFSSFSGI
ncbi:SDR family oxidoreductase [Sphingobacterium sp. UBA5670]|uniref:SDR family oxidoreductase n=1 Tax=Sphingobacterium sp. UBA5670 TaxID=1947502 RepID=UPI0025E8D517|nr:SDR family oxidoreductase [Sphingobacterium sp. UBA5670]